MSRLDSFIARMKAQRDCLNFLKPAIDALSGPILEVGLGNGRTYDHLRDLFPGRDIFVFERKVAAHPDCIPPDDRLFLGEASDSIPRAAARLGATAALIHTDLGTGADLSTSNPDLAMVANTPQITGLTPGKASTLGGSTVTINGSGFVSGATVRLTLGATNVVISNATVSADGMSISFQAPANTGKPGLYDVTVVNPDNNTAMQAKAFTYFLGTVSFATATSIAADPLDRGPRSVVAVDINKDNNLDLVVAYANSNTVAILLGDGTGKFTGKTTNMGVGTYPYSVTVGDVDGDGKLDVVTPNQGGPSVSLLLGQGDGTLKAPVNLPATAGSQPQSVVLVDANNDNKLDLLVGNFYNAAANPTNNLTALLNQGGTSFNAAQMTVGGGLYALAAGDFDKNGKLDAIGVHRLAAGTASLTTLINKGGNVSPYFTTAGNQSGGGEAVTAASADFDGDGKLDLAVGNNTASSVAIARGSGLAQNTLADPVAANQYTVGNANARVEHLVAFDVDLDGTPDVVTANYNTAAQGRHPGPGEHRLPRRSGDRRALLPAGQRSVGARRVGGCAYQPVASRWLADGLGCRRPGRAELGAPAALAKYWKSS